MIKSVVIVGGGFTGLIVYKIIAPKLDENTRLVLISPRSFFIHFPATLRALISSDGGFEEKAIMNIPDHQFNSNNGTRRIIIGHATSIVDDEKNGHYVTLDNGERVNFSVLVLGTGSIREGPVAFPNNRDKLSEWFEDWRRQFEKAKNIVIVGGGAVGFELAGEIKDIYSEKSVTIVHGKSLPLNDAYSKRWRDTVVRRFEKRGVRLVLGDYLDDLEIKEGKVVTRKNVSIDADLVVTTRGSQPNTKFIESLGSDILTTDGFVRVEPSLQVIEHPFIFAGGDIIDREEQKQASKVPEHASVISKNVLSMLNLKGKPEDAKLSKYKLPDEGIFLTNGRRGGAVYSGGVIFGDWVSRFFKSKNLLVYLGKFIVGLA